MTDLDALALRVAVFKALFDRVKAEYDTARATLGETLGPEGRKNAVFANQKLASISVTTAGRVSVDEPKVSRWCAELYPTEVEERPVIRPAFLEQLKSASAAAGEPCSPFGDLDIPGISVGDPFPSCRFAPGGREAIAELWTQGRIDLSTGAIRELENE